MRDWLVDEDKDLGDGDGLGIALRWTKKPFVQPLVHADASGKASWLQQAPCVTCLPTETGPFVSFAIRTRPFSAQSLTPSMLRALKTKITASMAGRFPSRKDWAGWDEAGLCVTAGAVMGRGDALKDVDNMVKGLLDALQGELFSNDRAIAHLSVHRLRHAGDDGHYLLYFRSVLDPLEDVIDPRSPVGWRGIPEITI